jgi:4-alpha-glucanotransferase
MKPEMNWKSLSDQVARQLRQLARLHGVLTRLETLPQNVPGTSTERVNWRRRTRLTREQMAQDPVVSELMQLVSAARRPRNRQSSFS